MLLEKVWLPFTTRRVPRFGQWKSTRFPDEPAIRSPKTSLMDTPSILPALPFRIWPYLLVNLVAAVWLDFTSFHRLATSDSIVFVLASLYEMRLFFWEQDRIGMLVPLLAAWCRSPFHNLLIQTGSMIFLGLTMPVMLARVLTPHRMAPLAVTAMNAAFLFFAPDTLHENWMLVCNYPSGLLLGFTAISIVDSRPTGASWNRRALRLIGCAVLMLLAHWQYFGAILYLGPLVVFRAWLQSGPGAPAPVRDWRRIVLRPFTDSRARLAVLLMLLALGAIGVTMLLVRRMNPITVRTSPSASPPELWLSIWSSMFGNVAELPGMAAFAACAVGVCAVGFTFALCTERRLSATMAIAVLPALLAASVEFGFLGTRDWMIRNDFHPRYLVAALTSLTTALALLGLVPILSRLPRRYETAAILSAGALLLAAATGRYGWPSSEGVRRLLDDQCGEMTPVLIETQCEAVGGEYWVVWMSMFHINMALYDRGEDRVVFGVGYRSQPMRGRWSQFPDGFRVALPEEDFDEIQSKAEYRGLAPFEKLEERGEVLFPAHPHADPRTIRVGIYRTKIGK